MRRLRENSMLEAEISPSGTVLVEGHHVGELQGFRFTADQSVGGEDAKAVRNAAQKALAAEFESRAERFAGSPNGDIALGSDGVLRWIGAPIGTLVEGEDALKPRVVILADEQLTGPARDKVAARADRFVNFQIELLLKPLVDLKSAEQLSGIGRGIAFQLVENFGLMNRRDIAEEVKSLDQEGRAALRRLGVRFGAYHVFVPALIKPAPASLVTLLWALKNDGKDKAGFGDVVHALAAGRTSVVIDPTFDKAFYKLAGFRNLGRRAVRVDILERLADLIRPALSWKQGSGARPEGAFDGSAFVVTPQMMSILGATGDDMEEILKGLGYRAEPKPAAEVKEKLEAIDAAARDAVAKAAAAKAAAAEAAAGGEAADISTEAFVESAEAAEAVAGAEGEQAPEAVAEPTDAVAEPVVEVVAEPVVEAEVAVAADAVAVEATEVAVAEVTVVEAGEPAEEPKPILIWRQGRFEQRPRHRQDNRPRGGQREQRAAGAPGAPNARQGEGNRGREGGEGGRDNGRPRFDRKPGGKPQGEGGRPEHRNRGERPGGDKREGDRGGFKGKPAFQPKPREERPVRIDPDSPFAKLAALRDQLKK